MVGGGAVREERSIYIYIFTSWPISMLQSFVDWALASTITLNMVHIDCGTRKSVDRLVFCSLTSNAILVLLKQSRKRPIQHSDGSGRRRHFLRGQWKRKLKAVISFNRQWLHMCSFKNDFPSSGSPIQGDSHAHPSLSAVHGTPVARRISVCRSHAMGNSNCRRMNEWTKTQL